MSNSKLDALAAAYAREMALWRDPEEAPSVPDKSILEKFVEDPDAVEADLAAQIREDINCRRALDSIKFEKYGVFKSEPLISVEELGKMVESLSEPKTRLVFDREKENMVKYPHKGDIFYTQSRLPVLKKEGGSCSFVYTFKPCAVLLLDDGEKMPWNDKVFRCAVVTPDYMGKAVEGQDMDLKNGWILHKWLSYPVSIYQLDTKNYAASVENIDEIADAVNSFSFSDEQMTRYGREEKRLMAKAGYVSVVADTRMAASQMTEEKVPLAKSAINRLRRFFAEWTENNTVFGKPLVYAAADSDSSNVFIKKGECAIAEACTAHLADPILLAKDEISDELPEWYIDSKEIDIPENMVFVLKNEKGCSVGYGYIYHCTDHETAKLVEYFPERLDNDITSADQVSLEVYIPW